MKGFIGFLIGATIGSTVTFLVTRHFDNKKNDEELKKMDEYYRDKISKPVENKEISVQEEPEIKEQPSEEAEKLAEKKHYEYDVIHQIKGDAVDYKAMYKDKGPSIMRREEDPDPLPEGNTPYLPSDPDLDTYNEMKGMVIISDTEWEEDDDYTKIEMTYYEHDEIFVDQSGHEIDYMTADMVGRPNLNHFGITGEEGVLYVRSTDTKTDYRIFLDEGDFYSVEE